MSDQSPKNAIDDLSLYDRSGNARSGSHGLLIALLVSAAVMAGGVLLFEYGFSEFTDTAAADKTLVATPEVPVVHGVISRAPVVALDREVVNRTDADSAETELTLINAVNRAEGELHDPAGSVSKVVADKVDESVSSGIAGVNAADTDSTDVFGGGATDGEEVTVYLPVNREAPADAAALKQATPEEVERLYSTPAVQQGEAFLPNTSVTPSGKPEKSSRPAAEARKPGQKAAVVRPPDARCIIARRELAGVRSLLAGVTPGDSRQTYLAEQQDYYQSQVGSHCR